MAKKTRTPAPPRKVQAPQRRTDPRRSSGLLADRRALALVAFAVLGIAGAVAAAVIVFAGGDKGSSAPNVPTTAGLVGVQTGPAPWNPALDTLPDRLDPLGLSDLTTEGQVLHIHQHLDIYVNGKHEPVPPNIGIYDGQFITELHTHDGSGIMHLESPEAKEFDLGQFFGVWGVRLTSECIGGYCKDVTPWQMYVNGRAYTGNPAGLVLRSHQEIAFVIGTPPKKIPSKYTFPGGL